MDKKTPKTPKTVWEKNPKLKVLHKTSDGNKFFKPEDAHTHARSLEDKTVTPVKRPVKAKKPNPPAADKPSAEERAASIGKLKTIEEVNKALKGDKSKTVIAAGKARIKELTPAE